MPDSQKVDIVLQVKRFAHGFWYIQKEQCGLDRCCVFNHNVKVVRRPCGLMVQLRGSRIAVSAWSDYAGGQHPKFPQRKIRFFA